MKRLLVSAVAVLAASAAFETVQAADMPVKAAPIAPLVDPWSGWYVGGNAGYGWGRARTTISQTLLLLTTTTTSIISTGEIISVVTEPDITVASSFSGTGRMDGWIGGGQVGYNWKSGNRLFGIEADLQSTGQEGGSTFCVAAGCPGGTPFTSANFHLRWFGTLRGRLGWLWDNNTLFYVTGGLAVGHIRADYSTGLNGAPVQATTSLSHTRAGWIVGAGGERRLSDRWSVKLEYLYMDLGSVNSATGTSFNGVALIGDVGDTRVVVQGTTNTSLRVNTRLTDQILRFGVNYRI